MVKKKVKKKGKKAATRKQSPKLPDTKVKCSLGLTISANYQSGRVDFGIEKECFTEDLGRTIEECWELCEEEVARKSSEVQETLEAMKNGA